MIEHVYRRTAAAPSVEAVVVATDDERIVRAVEAFGGIAKLTSSSHRSGSDRLAEVAAGLECELVVNVQGDEPLIDPQMIEEAIAPFRDEPDLQIGTLCRRIQDPREYVDPNIVKVVVGPDGYALYFSRSPIPFVREGHRADPTVSGWTSEGDVPAYKHVGLYVYRRTFLLAFARLAPTRLERAEALEQLRALEHGIRLKTVETTRDSIGVDTPEDLERVRHLVAATSCP